MLTVHRICGVCVAKLAFICFVLGLCDSIHWTKQLNVHPDLLIYHLNSRPDLKKRCLNDHDCSYKVKCRSVFLKIKLYLFVEKSRTFFCLERVKNVKEVLGFRTEMHFQR